MLVILIINYAMLTAYIKSCLLDFGTPWRKLQSYLSLWDWGPEVSLIKAWNSRVKCPSVILRKLHGWLMNFCGNFHLCVVIEAATILVLCPCEQDWVVCKASFTEIDPALLSKRQRADPPPLVNFLFILAFWFDDALVSTIDFLHLDDWSGSPSSALTTFCYRMVHPTQQ
jgi:hypothetical protein